MKILSGVYQPDAGEIRIAGQAATFDDAADANRKGIGMVFQEQSLLTNMTVGENIYLGNEAQFTRFGIVDWGRLYAAAERQLAKVQVDVDPRARADTLSFASRQMVELAKALTLEEHAGDHLVILLDEPTSVLERAEIDILFERVRALKSRASFIFVSHRLDEVLELADRIYVMKDGAVVADLNSSEADTTKLHHLMVGRSLQAEYYREPLQRPYRENVVLETENLSLGHAYKNVTFQLHAGEILGIAGVIGSGREELTRTLAPGATFSNRARSRRIPSSRPNHLSPAAPESSAPVTGSAPTSSDGPSSVASSSSRSPSGLLKESRSARVRTFSGSGTQFQAARSGSAIGCQSVSRRGSGGKGASGLSALAEKAISLSPTTGRGKTRLPSDAGSRNANTMCCRGPRPFVDSR